MKIQETKKCKSCEEEKGESEFYIRKFKDTLESGKIVKRERISTVCTACEKSESRLRSKARYAKEKADEYKKEGFSMFSQEWLCRRLA
jgi:hypothetical protein